MAAPRKSSKKLISRLINEHRFGVIAAILILGSWIAQNFFEAKWSSEKQNVTTWAQYASSIHVNLTQWHVSILQYKDHFAHASVPDSPETFMKFEDSIENDKSCAALCRNWLQTYYEYLMVSKEITVPDSSERRKIQRVLKDSMRMVSAELKSGHYRFLTDLFLRRILIAGDEMNKTAQEARNRMEFVEKKSDRWNKIFLILYIAGTVFLGLNFIDKERRQNKK